MKKTSTPSQITPKRIFAGLIDLVLCIVAFVVATLTFGTVTTTTVGENVSHQASLTGMPALLFGLGVLSYFILMEWCFSASLGKLAFGLRVASEDGKKPTIHQIILRNIFRIIDAFPYFIPYVAGLAFIAGNEKRQRLGDIAAKTIIVSKTEK